MEVLWLANEVCHHRLSTVAGWFSCAVVRSFPIEQLQQCRCCLPGCLSRSESTGGIRSDGGLSVGPREKLWLPHEQRSGDKVLSDCRQSLGIIVPFLSLALIFSSPVSSRALPRPGDCLLWCVDVFLSDTLTYASKVIVCLRWVW